MTVRQTPMTSGRIEPAFTSSWTFHGFQMPTRTSEGVGQRFETAPIAAANNTSTSRNRQDKFDYVLIYSFTYFVLLVAALLQRVLPRSSRSFPCNPDVKQSVFAEARRATSNIMPFAFMG